MRALITQYAFAGFMILFLSAPCYGQKKKKTVKPAIDTNSMLQDIFAGPLPDGDDTIYTSLTLNHKINHDYGTFSLDQTKNNRGETRTYTTPGNWTVLNGSAVDEYEKVVALESPDFSLFFLRRPDGKLQKLNAKLEEVEPTQSYILAPLIKSAKLAVNDTLTTLEKNMRSLSGTYKGKLHCANCTSITSTLTLNYKLHAKTGAYTLNDKYLGTSTGDINNEKKGKWSFVSKQVDGVKGMVVVLDSDIRGRESWYLVKKDGNLIQLDKNCQRISAPVDQTLKKQ